MFIVDLSNNNPAGAGEWEQLRRDGVDAVWLKASEGRSFTDDTYRQRHDRARAAGLHAGAYHFARPDLHPGAAGARYEAGHFCAVVEHLHGDDLRPALDLEVGAPKPDYAPWARAWNAEVRRLLGALPIFYSYPSYIEGLHVETPVGEGLWLASYGRDDGAEHAYRVPAPWRHVVAHQFSSRARLRGIPGMVDLSYTAHLPPLLVDPGTTRR